MKEEIIITDCDHSNVDIERSIFDAAGVSFRLLQCRTEEDLIAQCGGCAVFINQYAPVTERVMRALPEMRMVVRYGVGVNNIDVKAATALGIQVCNVPDYGMNEVADHAAALTLALVRKLPLMDVSTKRGGWDYAEAIPIQRLSACTVAIIGMGRIGRAYAKRMHAHGCRVIGYDPYYKPTAQDGAEYIMPVTLDEAIDQADILSLHCPLEGNRNLIDRDQLRRMKKTAYIINTTRGGVINESALEEALCNGEIAGAGLDVFDREPVAQESPLLRHENVIATPHMAWYSEESSQELNRKAAEEALRAFRKEPVWYPVNRLEGRKYT